MRRPDGLKGLRPNWRCKVSLFGLEKSIGLKVTKTQKLKSQQRCAKVWQKPTGTLL